MASEHSLAQTFHHVHKVKDHHSYKESIKFANIHKQIIKQFGRFPHRNNVLKRSSTLEEEKYLNSIKYDFFNI